MVRQILWQIFVFRRVEQVFSRYAGMAYAPKPFDIQKDGRGAQIRTGDPLLPKQVRYQAALHPDPRITRVFWQFKQAFKSTKVELSGHFWTKGPLQIPFTYLDPEIPFIDPPDPVLPDQEVSNMHHGGD